MFVSSKPAEQSLGLVESIIQRRIRWKVERSPPLELLQQSWWPSQAPKPPLQGVAEEAVAPITGRAPECHKWGTQTSTNTSTKTNMSTVKRMELSPSNRTMARGRETKHRQGAELNSETPLVIKSKRQSKNARRSSSRIWMATGARSLVAIILLFFELLTSVRGEFKPNGASAPWCFF